GSTNPHNMVLAALDGLMNLTTVEQIAKERGIEVSQMGYRSRAKSRTEKVDPKKAAVTAAEVA
ncbi:MAG: hypothetical protein ACO1Q7_02315, partial [Gemmatimonas sp.]